MKKTSATCLFLALLLTGCQQEMARQPSYKPLEPSSFFPDGRSARPLVPGTVARGHLRNDPHLFAGLTGAGGTDARRVASVWGLGTANVLGALAPATEKNELASYADTFPFPIGEEELKRGQQRYTIFCAVCHDPLGTGKGKIVERGYVQPPNYHADYARGLLRRGIKIKLPEVPVGYYYAVISNGYGAMPDYASQVPPDDRWKIIAYIRALQFSQNARLTDLPEEERQKARKALEGKP